ncbi:MAG: MFS transporter [Bacteroidia bacterium]|nr:MFS transporter [Bacteroidia bacterium]
MNIFTVEKNNPKELWAWCLYDWANSAFTLVISRAIFPIYYYSVAPEIVVFLGQSVGRESIRSFAIAIAYMLILVFNPYLGGIADSRHLKKFFLMLTCYLGAIASCGLYFFDETTVQLGLFLFILGSFCYANSESFYNSFLPDTATEDRFDSLSAKGFSLGYLGSSILLLISLLLITFSDSIGIEKGIATRLSFLLTGIWWAGFGSITFLFLRERKKTTVITKSIDAPNKLKETLEKIQTSPILVSFLLTFFCYNMGVQTIIQEASDYGIKEIKVTSENLIAMIFVLQIVGIIGATIFAKINEKKGEIFGLQLALICWVLIVGYAYFINTPTEFYLLGSGAGFLMGATQSTSRAFFSRLVPQEEENATYFSFYSVLDKLAIILGTLSFGLINQWTGSMRNAVLFLVFFFLLGILLLFRTKKLYRN